MDRKYLVKQYNTYSVVVEVPKPLQAKAGRKRFKKSLGTDSLLKRTSASTSMLLTSIGGLLNWLKAPAMRMRSCPGWRPSSAKRSKAPRTCGTRTKRTTSGTNTKKSLTG